MIKNKPFSHWEQYYRDEHNIKLVGLYRPNQNYIGRHLLESHEVYKYLKTHEHVFDIAHFHDYRGAAYYSLLAKTQGLFLRNLLIVIQTHGNNKWAKVVGNSEVLGDVGELERGAKLEEAAEHRDVAAARRGDERRARRARASSSTASTTTSISWARRSAGR